MKNKQTKMELFTTKGNNFLQAGKFIDPLSATLQHELSAGQKVTGMNVPLVSFGNPVIDDLQRDLYWSMFLAKDNLAKASPEGREVVRGLLEWVLSDPTFKVKTMMLVNHKVSAASASYVMVENLMNMPEMEQGLSGMGKAEQMEDKADSLDEQSETQQDSQGEDGQDNPAQSTNTDDSEAQGGSGSDWDEDGDGEGSGGGDEWSDDDESYPDLDYPENGQGQEPTPEELRQQAQDLREQAASLKQQAEAQIQQAMQAKMNEFARSGSIDAGTGYGEEIAAFLASWGVDEGQGMMISAEQIMAIMKALNVSGIGALTALIGRVHGIASDTLRGRSSAKVIVDEGGITKDILDMAPAERYKLSKGYPFRAQAVNEWLTRGLGGVTKSMQATREGNFICFVDESGSMGTSTRDGTREEIAKALALGLSKAAIDNGQEITLAGFGSRGEITELVTNSTPLDKKLEWATFMFNGGTNFGYALETMMDIVDQYDDGEKLKTDFVMITDGDCNISEESILRLLEMKQAYGIRLFVLLIDGRAQQDLLDVADEIMKFDGLDDIATKLSGLIWQEA